MSPNTSSGTVIVAVEPADTAGDAATVDAIAALVNRVYERAEAGLWVDGAQRTTPAEVAGLVADGQIATARVGDPTSDGAIPHRSGPRSANNLH